MASPLAELEPPSPNTLNITPKLDEKLGRQIRAQVEYYFSDDNLRTDLHLLQCCNGRENVPVSLSRICGWRMMRKYKKRDVVTALRESRKLILTEDGKKVSRKVALSGPCLLDPDFKTETPVRQKGGPLDAIKENEASDKSGDDRDDDEEDDEIAYDPRSKRRIAHPLKPIPQDKKALPPGVTKNMLKPTGFEPTYVEAPLTPAEAQEEEAMYDPEKSFAERIEIAIQRFKQKRRMHEMYAKVFNKWMKFGGVDCTPRMFGGVSQQEMKEMTAEEIARATATHHVPWDREEKDKWVVDFVGVAEGFFSSFYPSHYGHLPAQVKSAAQVLRSFYNYLLFHNVCPEYNDSVLAARALCDKVETELPQTYRAGNALPGTFNTAASSLFGGYYANAWVGSSGWGADLKDYERLDSSVGMPHEEAWQAFKWGLTYREIWPLEVENSEKIEMQVDLLNRIFKPNDKDNAAVQAKYNITVVEKVQVFLEIVDIQTPTEESIADYEKAREQYMDKTGGIWGKPLGRIICQTVVADDFTHRFKGYDLPAHLDPRINKEQRRFIFYVEEEVLAEILRGFKMDASVMVLRYPIVQEDGTEIVHEMHVLDQVKDMFCSFYRFLPNELWEARKGPRYRVINKGLEDVMEKKDDEGKGEEAEVGEGETDGDLEMI